MRVLAVSVSVTGCIPVFVSLVAGGVLGLVDFAVSAPAGGLAFTDNPIRLIVYGGAYVWAAAWLYSARRGGAATTLAKLWPVWLLLVHAMCSLMWSAYPLKTVIDCGHLIGATLVAAAFVVATQGNGLAVAIVVLAAMGASLIVSMVAIKQGLPAAFDAETGRWAGSAGNPNSLGFISAAAIWSAAVVLLCARRLDLRLAAVAICALAAVALKGSQSATSLIVAALLVSGVIWVSLGALRSGVRVHTRMLTGLMIVASAAVLATSFAPQLLDVSTGLKVLGRSDNLTGRTELWAFALDQFHQHPVRGHGFDSLASVLEKLNSPLGQMHNGYLDLLVRGGLIGITLFVIIVVVTFMRACTDLQESAKAALLVLVIGVLVHNITESSIARPAHPLWLLMLIAVAAFSYRTIVEQSVRKESNAPSDAHSARAAPLPNLLR